MKEGEGWKGEDGRGDEGREVGGGVGPSSPWATGACTHRRGSGGGHCLFMGGCGCLCIIVSVTVGAHCVDSMLG